MRRFFIYLYLITAAIQVPFVFSLAHAVGGPWGWVAAVAIAALAVASFHGRLELLRWDQPISRARRALVEEPFYVHWCASLLAFALSVVTVPVALLLGRAAGEGFAVAYLFALSQAMWGVLVRRRWVIVRQLEVLVSGLPAAFDGYRVAQMSDLHMGSLCPRERVDEWVRRVNVLDVDLVALTGDYVTSGVRFHEDIAAALGALEARDGVFAVMGNHDYYGDGEPLMTLLAERGIRLLRNAHALVTRDGAELVVAGVDDVFTRRIDIEGTIEAIPDGKSVLMLAHDPRTFPEIAERGSALVLSGHTHWGQVGVPWLAAHFNYANLMTRFSAGLHRIGDAVLYVSPGLGTTGPPVRFGAAPEITVITLRAS